MPNETINKLLLERKLKSTLDLTKIKKSQAIVKTES